MGRSRVDRDSTRRTGGAGGGPAPPGGAPYTFWSSPLIQSAAAVAGAIDVYWFPSLVNLTPAGVVSSGVSFQQDVTIRRLRLWYRQIGAPNLGDGELQIDSASFSDSAAIPAPGGSGSFLDFALEGTVTAGDGIRIFGVWNQNTDDGAVVQSVLSFELVAPA